MQNKGQQSTNLPIQQIAIATLLLGGFAVLGTALVALTHNATKDRILANERAAMLRSLNELIPQDQYNNDLLLDTIKVTAPTQLGRHEPVTVFRARHDGEPVAAVLSPVAPDGYSGRIKLLVAIRYDGTLAGVRVIQHRETPGLGDAIEVEKSDWIRQFAGRTLGQPPPGQWKVEKDGGAFDQLTGATITSRAVVKAVYKTLIYFREHRDELFRSAASQTEQQRASGE